jgi:hypothetical protein
MPNLYNILLIEFLESIIVIFKKERNYFFIIKMIKEELRQLL